MSGDHSSKAPVLLRPLHRWFWFWERRISSIYRVVAVSVGAVILAWIGANLTGAPWYAAAPASLALWVGLAVAQEHDERVTLPVDEDFHEQLRRQVDPVVSAAGYEFDAASGANRARGGAETFTYRHPDDGRILWIFRNRREGAMGLAGWFDVGLEPTFLPDALLDRVVLVKDAASDARAVAAVLQLWVRDHSIQLPDATAPTASLRRRRGGPWFNYGRTIRTGR